MSDLRAEARSARKTQRAAHLAGSIERYLMLVAAALVLFLLLHLELVPGTSWRGWSYGVVICGLLLGILLIWISEHRRTA